MSKKSNKLSPKKPKMSTYIAPAVLSLAVTGGLLGAAAATANPGGKIEIIHKPGTPAEKRMSVPQSALAGHLGHGDVIAGKGKGKGK